MSLIETIQSHLPLSDDTWVLFIVFSIILFAPLLMNRLRIPHIIGMILAGVLLGQYGFNILELDNTFASFGQFGLYYIMFLAGLEMNLEDLKNCRHKSILFGVLTFAVPFCIGLWVSLSWLHLSWAASILLASVLSSHTLVSYPIVSRYGLNKHESVIFSVGATLVTLTISLFILAGVSSISEGETGFFFWAILIVKCLLFMLITVLVFPRLARWFFRKYGDNVMQFVFVLALLCLGAILAKVAGLDGIFGAFLVGLVLNRYIPSVSPLMNRIEFVGNALFIPYFLIGVGMIINIRYLFTDWHNLQLILIILLTATVTKWIAAFVAQKIFKKGKPQRQMMFGLTNAHAAGALAIIMVGTRIETAPGVFLIGDEILNAVVIIILFSCIISSLVTEHAARQLVKLDDPLPAQHSLKEKEKIVISIANPETMPFLVNTALLMRNVKQEEELIGLHVSVNDDDLEQSQKEGKKLLEEASKIASSVDVFLSPQCRIGTNVAASILHTTLECDATVVILGLHQKGGALLDSFYGSTTRELVYGINKQVIIVRSNIPVNTLRRIVVYAAPAAEFEAGFYKWIERLCRMGEQIGCQMFFYAHHKTLQLIERYISSQHSVIRANYCTNESWKDFLDHAKVNDDHLLVLVNARRGSISWNENFDNFPTYIDKYYAQKNIMIIYPDLFGEAQEPTSFSEPIKPGKRQIYGAIRHWIERIINRKK